MVRVEVAPELILGTLGESWKNSPRMCWDVYSCVPAWCVFSSAWSQSSSTPIAAPRCEQRWPGHSRMLLLTECHQQTRPGWTRCLCSASPEHMTTVHGERDREREGDKIKMDSSPQGWPITQSRGLNVINMNNDLSSDNFFFFYCVHD